MRRLKHIILLEELITPKGIKQNFGADSKILIWATAKIRQY